MKQDIVLVTSGTTITSTFSGISATRKYAPITYLWSDAQTDSVRTICSSSNVNLSVVATSGGCSDTGTVKMRVGGVKINLGADVVRCNPTQTNVFTAPTGYTGYYWFDGNTSSNIYTAYNNGEYRIRAVDSANCVSRDTIKLFDANNYYLSVADTAIPCAGSSVTLDASVNIQKNGDSLTIIYDATQGVTGLVGAAKVYFHSGPEFHAFSGWQLGYTVGNFNLDDGIGQMKSLGNNRWSITIHPQTYYNYPVDSSLNGIFMVFRNFDGSQTGKDWANNNIFVLTATVPPSSQFTGVTAQHKARANVT